MNNDGLTNQFGVMIKEGKRRLLPLSVVFAVVALVTLGIGIVMPKRWDATTLIIVDNDTAIKPLMGGGTSVTPVAAQTALVTQVVLGNKMLKNLAVDEGLMPAKTNPQDQERILSELRKRIKIENKNDALLRISYSDADPKRAAHVTNALGKTFIGESATLKEGASREAFNFLDNRAKEYGQKLTEAHKKLLDYYRGESTRAVAGARSAVAARAASVPVGARLSAEELASLRVEAATLEAQLGHKTPAALALDTKNEEQARMHVAQAQSELDRLLATFTDEHPDVRRARSNLGVAKEELHRTEQARTDLEKTRAQTAALDDEVSQAARGRLAEVQQKLAAATGRRIRSGGTMLARATPEDPEKDPEMKGVGQDTTQSELFRVYDSTRELYQDLLKRRENARVSMDLDAEHHGFTMRVQEEAEVPATASSLRLMNVAIIGLVLALAVPIGLVFAIVKFDKRVRASQEIERLAHVPLLAAIPFDRAHARSLGRGRDFKVALIVTGVFLVYGATFVIKMMST